VTAVLRLLAVLLTVFWLAVVGWLIYRAIRARVGVAGNILLFAIQIVLSFSAVYVLVLLNLASPLRVLWWIPLVGGTIALANLTLKALPFPTPLWLAALLGTPRRRRVTPPVTVISRMGISPGMTVVEVGAGSGHLSFEVAKLLVPGGRLMCIDIQPEMIEAIRTRIVGSGVDNIETYVALAERLPARISGVDLVLLVAVLGEVKDKHSALAEAFRVLKPGGALSISEFTDDPHYCPKEEVKHLAKQAGFEDWTTEGDALGYTASLRKPRAAAQQPLPAGHAEKTGPPAEHRDSPPVEDDVSL